jgi:hypothetical protein
MATEYYETPSLTERIMAANVIITGTVGRLVAVETLLDNPLQILGRFELRVESAWKGQPESILELRVLGKRDDDRITWITDLQENQRYLFILARDTAPPDPEVWYVPYFAAAYRIDSDGQVQLPTEIFDERTREIVDNEHGASLEILQKVIDTLLREQAEKRLLAQELVPAGELAEPYSTILEMPDEFSGAGRNAVLDSVPPSTFGTQ